MKLPHGMEFLCSLNRLNVATSRAKCLALVVAKPIPAEGDDAALPRQMRLANAIARLVEMASLSSTMQHLLVPLRPQALNGKPSLTTVVNASAQAGRAPSWPDALSPSTDMPQRRIGIRIRAYFDPSNPVR